MSEFPYNEPYFAPNEGTRDEYGHILGVGTYTKSITPQAITVGVTATAVPPTASTGRKSLIIQNNGNTLCYVGDATVTTATGYCLLPRAAIQFAISDKVDVYVISASAGADIRALEGV